MRVLGVDPGTRFLGYGVLDTPPEAGGAASCLAWGTLEGGRSKEIGERLLRIRQGLAEVVERWRPDQLAVEEPFVAIEHGAKSAVAIGQAQAVALILAAEAGIPVFRYLPSQVKSTVADYGAGTKQQVQRAVRLLLGLGEDAMSLDASDALAVALCHLQHWRVAERVRAV